MKTKTILKTLAVALLMPAMLLTTACSSDDNIIDSEKSANTKGYALPVTVNVTRQGDEGTTRATYTDNGNGTGSLAFSAGDKLFVSGSYNDGNYTFAGMLDYVSDGKFSGTIMTQTEWTGTTEELLSADGGANATLLPAGYGEYGYLSIADEGTYEARLIENPNKAFATSKATAVEQFSWEDDNEYSSSFELTPVNAILNFTINGLDASTEVDVSFSYPNYPDPIVISGKVTTDGDGTATFAIGIIYDNNLKDCTLTVGGLPITLTSSSKMVEAGHIYNISRNAKVVIWNSSKVAGIDINENSEDNSFESDGITVAAFGDSGANFTDSKMSFGGSDGYFTFTSSVGNIKKIEINYTGDVFGYEEEPVGWSLGVGTFTWEGDPATSVTLPSSGYASIEGITSIVFTLE